MNNGSFGFETGLRSNMRFGFNRNTLGGFLPSDIANLQLWMDATDSSTITKDGSGFISQWEDKSANSYLFTQATGSKQPQSIANGFGTQNKPYVKFVSANNMTLPTNANIELGVMTMFFALRVDAYGAAGGVVDKWLNDTGYSVDTQGLAIKKPRIKAGTTNIASLVSTELTPALIAVKINGANSFIEVNGTRTTGTLNTTPTSVDSLFLGGDGVSTLYNSWSLAEYVMYKSALTDAQVTQVSNYLNSKYGVY